jgi:hypothetical protein
VCIRLPKGGELVVLVPHLSVGIEEFAAINDSEVLMIEENRPV